jgi:hypothetical protein
MDGYQNSSRLYGEEKNPLSLSGGEPLPSGPLLITILTELFWLHVVGNGKLVQNMKRWTCVPLSME